MESLTMRDRGVLLGICSGVVTVFLGQIGGVVAETAGQSKRDGWLIAAVGGGAWLVSQAVANNPITKGFRLGVSIAMVYSSAVLGIHKTGNEEITQEKITWFRRAVLGGAVTGIVGSYFLSPFWTTLVASAVAHKISRWP